MKIENLCMSDKVQIENLCMSDSTKCLRDFTNSVLLPEWVIDFGDGG